ncbi:hypothetical protein ACIPX0_09935 [Streptomyces sp. NPDC090075]|uniref:hypothetical protein n=1 Tax=Streptomyces sp. NPDC090075 TaxID=3365937 RepID=UPI00381178BF
MVRRYHPPTDITLPEGLSAETGERLRATVVAAIRRAVRDAEPGETSPPPTSPRPRPRARAATGTDRRDYAVPSYDNDGERVGIPVASQAPAPAPAPAAPLSPRDPTNPHNTLTIDEMHEIWRKYWISRLNRAIRRGEEIRLEAFHRDRKAYSNDMDAFIHGHRRALGPAYQAAMDERDGCAFILSAPMQGWLLIQKQHHRPFTMEEMNAEAFRRAQAHAFVQGVLAPIVIAGAGGVLSSGPRTAPPSADEVPTPRGLPPVRSTEPVRPIEPVEPVAPGPSPAAATARVPSSAPGGFTARARAWAVRFGLNRAMTGVDQALPAPRMAASSAPAPTEQTSPPAPGRPSTTTQAPAPEPTPARTAPAARPLDLTEPRLTTDDVFARLYVELAHLPSAPPSGTGVPSAVADAQAAGLLGPLGAPGTVDLAVQRHADASAVRGAHGVTGAQVQSAHTSPTSFLRDVTGYSRGDAPSTLLPTWAHTAFDQPWKNWAMARRRAGDTQVTVARLYAEMLAAVDRIPLLDQATRNTIAWVIHRELFYDLGLSPGDNLTLPYPNVPPSP